MTDKRLEQQHVFIREVDELNSIERQTLISDASRQENDAGHSWWLGIRPTQLRSNHADVCPY